jgi:predicted nucleotide-binding protein (sugar kinase/HSP70/actin superfamily)
VKKLTAYEPWKAREAAWRKTPGTEPEPPDVQAGGTPMPVRASPRTRVGLLRGLGTYGMFPYWRTFLQTLGCEVVLSPRSSESLLAQGDEITTAEYCAPVVMSHGHARTLLEDETVDYLFVPHLLREPVPPGFTDAHYCCYVQAHPGVLRSVKGLKTTGRLLAPVVQRNLPETYQVERLTEVLSGPLGVDAAQVRRALQAGDAAQTIFQTEALRAGRDALARIQEENTLGIVCVGRPYNTVDPGLTLDLPRKIAELGYPVLYMDMLPMDLEAILPEHANMYWHYGQKILATAEYIARQNRLFGVYFTNFMCGPDSYILTYFKEIMGRVGKPYLSLQFDGHGADGGYLTRVEAALESFHSWSNIPRPQAEAGATRSAVEATGS